MYIYIRTYKYIYAYPTAPRMNDDCCLACKIMIGARFRSRNILDTAAATIIDTHATNSEGYKQASYSNQKELKR
jgi:hypothetical protein